MIKQQLRLADLIVSSVSHFFCCSSCRQEKLEFLNTLFLENEQEMSEKKKYRAMFPNWNDL